MADAFASTSLTTTPTVVFDATTGAADSVENGGGGPCRAFSVNAIGGNTFVNCQGLHANGAYYGPLPIGVRPIPFRAGLNGIVKVTVKSDGSGSTASGGVEERL